ncbi:carboxy-S-adenosyl-L-methionine synthase CmoA [Tamilnaduibacter salinus]|uniref:Carboxy-S-adenosyl-L-methionine synthase n=1 Tax=Tamilnaduibacter salinus TaxID=1484056 RepID=A0A2A2HZ22_9GAMM|nr:carboxy-S-adenosyl-L-methionine synthase CmoA [Tamilnaduibacter salinus]PAV24871.1 carboxy-S-adenosyl-L-methionine synthase CmoA [Tamilnaduibacter salinus]
MSRPSNPDRPKAPLFETDRLYSQAGSDDAFRFDAAVARVFPDMIRRSVPGYTTIIPMIGIITDRFAQNGSHCYDLGCSLGASTLAMRHGVGDRDCRIIGVDNASDMIERCQHFIALDDHPAPVSLHCDDILDTPLSDASVTTLNFTLQFVEPDERLPLLRRIFEATRPGGALILSEKIRAEDEAEQQLQTDLHHDFKRANGYSDLEISQKRSALEQVLIPETLATHRERLEQAGFDTVIVWYQCFSFISLLAVRSQ